MSSIFYWWTAGLHIGVVALLITLVANMEFLVQAGEHLVGQLVDFELPPALGVPGQVDHDLKLGVVPVAQDLLLAVESVLPVT